MRITESQLRRLIREEAARLTEMPARRGRGSMVTSDPDEMPPAPPPLSRKEKIRYVQRPDFLPYTELQRYGRQEDLDQLKRTNRRAYDDFLVSLYDMTEDGSEEGLDGKGFGPHLDSALRSSQASASRSFNPSSFVAYVNERMPVEVATRGGKGNMRLAGEIISDLYAKVVEPWDDWIRENDVQGTMRMMVGDTTSPGERRLLQVISKLHRHQQYPLTAAMSKASYAGSSVGDLEQEANWLSSTGQGDWGRVQA